MKIIWRWLAIFVLLASIVTPLLPAKQAQAWWDGNWTYRKVLAFPTTGFSGAVSNAPVLVTLDNSNFNFAQAQTNGEDIRFVDSDDATPLTYEIESWNATAEEARVWVLVPSLATTNDYIYMYWGNALAVDAQDAATLWTTAGAQAVWHMADGSGTNVKDSLNTNNGTINSAANVTWASDGLDFNGAADAYVTTTFQPATSTNATILSWVTTTNVSTEEFVAGNAFNTNGVGLGIISSAGFKYSFDYRGTLRYSVASGFVSGTEVQYSFTAFDNGTGSRTGRIYNNTTQVDSATFAAWPPGGDTTASNFNIGAHATAVPPYTARIRPWWGNIRELQYYNRALSTDEIRLHNLNRTDGLIYYGSTNPEPSVSTISATNITMDKDGVTGAVTVSGNVTDLGGAASANRWFEYGLTAAYGSTTANTSGGTGTFSAAIPTGLTPGQTYHFRAAASNNLTTTSGVGSDDTFTFTMPTPVTGTATAGVDPTNVTINGNLSSMGVASDTYVRFRWGYTVLLGNTTTLVTQSGTGAFSTTLTGIDPTQTLYYRAEAVVGAVTASGSTASLFVGGTPTGTGVWLMANVLGVVVAAAIVVTGVRFIGAAPMLMLLPITIGLVAFYIVRAVIYSMWGG